LIGGTAGRNGASEDEDDDEYEDERTI